MQRNQLFFVFGSLTGLAMLSACGSSEAFSRVRAKVERVERDCGFDLNVSAISGKSAESTAEPRTPQDCSNNPEFLRLRHSADKGRVMIGQATATVRYISPVDKQSRQAKIMVEAPEKAFFSLEAGQELDVFIDSNNPSKASL